MAEFDGSINIDTKINTQSFNAGMRKVTGSAHRAMSNLTFGVLQIGTVIKGVLTFVGKLIAGLVIGFFALVASVIAFGERLVDNIQSSVDVSSKLYEQTQALRHEFLRVRAAALSVFSTLLEAALPTIIRIVDWLVKMLDIINQVVAALLGQSTVQRVVASSVKETADNAGKAAKNTEKMKKSAQGALAAFDKLDVLTRKTAADDTDAGAGLGGLRFEEVPIEQKWVEVAAKIQEVLDRIASIFNSTILAIKAAWNGFVQIWDAFWKTPFGQELFATLKRLVINFLETFLEVKANVQRILRGITEIIAGIVNGDWSRIFHGLKEIVAGVFGIIVALIRGSINTWVILFQGLAAQLRLIWSGILAWIVVHVIEPLKARFAGALDWIRVRFGSAFEGVAGVIRSALNRVIDVLNGLLSRVATSLNSIAGMFNTFGGLFGIQFPAVVAPQIPKLATGAVIPANAEFLAVLGDQRSGKNIEAPAAMFEEMLKRAIEGSQGRQEITINFGGSLGELVRILKPEIDRENVRIGSSLIKGGL